MSVIGDDEIPLKCSLVAWIRSSSYRLVTSVGDGNGALGPSWSIAAEYPVNVHGDGCASRVPNP